jgi:hypothetical protein
MKKGLQKFKRKQKLWTPRQLEAFSNKRIRNPFQDLA